MRDSRTRIEQIVSRNHSDLINLAAYQPTGGDMVTLKKYTYHQPQGIEGGKRIIMTPKDSRYCVPLFYSMQGIELTVIDGKDVYTHLNTGVAKYDKANDRYIFLLNDYSILAGDEIYVDIVYCGEATFEVEDL